MRGGRAFKGHVLDETDGDVAVPRQLDKRGNFMIVQPWKRDPSVALSQHRSIKRATDL